MVLFAAAGSEAITPGLIFLTADIACISPFIGVRVGTRIS